MRLDSPGKRIIANVYNNDVLYKLVSKLLPFLFDNILDKYDEFEQAMLEKFSDFDFALVLCKKCYDEYHEELY